jgi:hypothetical protein
MTRTSIFDDAMKELDAKLAKETPLDVISHMNTAFPELATATLNERCDEEIAALREHLLNCERRLVEIATCTKGMSVAYTSAMAHLNKLSTSLEGLVTDERGYEAAPEPSRISVVEDLAQWSVHSNCIPPLVYNHLLQTFKFELQDAQAFLDMMKRREAVKARQVKATKAADKWRLPTTVVTTEKQKNAKTNDLQLERTETELCEMMTKLILAAQIQEVWADKMHDFKLAMKMLASEQLNVQQQMEEVWKSIVAKASV